MEKIVISGGNPIFGQVYISGSKNAALPIIAASLLSVEGLTLTNVPRLQDVITMLSLLSSFGAKISLNETGKLSIDSSNINRFEASYEKVSSMRASIVVLGPLLSRFGQAKVALPGGCAIGDRPIDFHIHGLEKMGVQIEIKNGFVVAHAPNGLSGSRIHFDQPSVTGTENLVMAATLAKGETIFTNCAQEPEVIDLCECLVKMGAKIEGYGTSTIVVQGVERMHSTQHSIIPDRIEAGTFMVAAAATRGKVTLNKINSKHLQPLNDSLQASGVDIQIAKNKHGQECLTVDAQNKKTKGTNIVTAPHPLFPTDLQAQFTVLNVISEGQAFVEENIFENRFMHCAELKRMGAELRIDGNRCWTNGGSSLTGVPVKATDLRASASLIIAGLVAEGKTEMNNVFHLDRGYENMEEKLSALGADITRVLE